MATPPATLRGCVLADSGRLRPNVVVFIDGRRSHDRVAMSTPKRLFALRRSPEGLRWRVLAHLQRAVTSLSCGTHNRARLLAQDPRSGDD